MKELDFILHETLQKDCTLIGDMKLCTLLLSNDSQYPWFILVPRRSGVKEVFEMSRDDQISFQIESNLIANMLVKLYRPDKLNIASLGNVVPQLHVHHIARFQNDPCWPKPIWGQKPPVSYSQEAIEHIVQNVKEVLGRNLHYRNPEEIRKN